MEETIGRLWHQLVTRTARQATAALPDYPVAAVTLDQVRQQVAILFRALASGDDKHAGSLAIKASSATRNTARRSLLTRLAGTDTRIDLAWRDAEALHLPPRIAWFADASLNRALYLWLAALAGQNPPAATRAPAWQNWLQRNAGATGRLLARYPGLARRYRTLVAAHLLQRPQPRTLPAQAAAMEQAIRAALQDPTALPAALTQSPGPDAPLPWPVPLWLHPQPPTWRECPADQALDEPDPEGGEECGESRVLDTDRRHRGERVERPDERDGLLAFRLESFFSRAEYVAVDRPGDDGDEADAKTALNDLERVSVARDNGRSRGARLRFDLDLPPRANDDLHLGPGIPLPEWDYRSGQLLPDHCRLQPLLARNAEPVPLPGRLRHQARRIRALFEQLNTRRVWLAAQADGTEVDIDALIDHTAERLRGHALAQGNCYRALHRGERDLACLLLADLSLSTDSQIGPEQRVIDVIRDSLYLFGEALAGTADRFALAGFSSRRRNHVRFHVIKGFAEPWSDTVRGRIQAIRPGYYTRMGAAIRQGTRLLADQPARQRLLLILTDGKPNDLDRYEGRYGIEDTRRAVHEARQQGLQPFCVTIDTRARDYLPYLFGANAWLLVRHVNELPTKLPALYGQLTG